MRVHIIFLTIAQNIDWWNPFESSQRGGSNEHPLSMFEAKIKKNVILDQRKSIISHACIILFT